MTAGVPLEQPRLRASDPHEAEAATDVAGSSERAAGAVDEAMQKAKSPARDAAPFSLSSVPHFALTPLVEPEFTYSLELSRDPAEGEQNRRSATRPFSVANPPVIRADEPLGGGRGQGVSKVNIPLLIPVADDSVQPPVVLDSPLLRELHRQLLGSELMAAPATPLVPERKARFDLLQARAGEATARGYLARGARGPAGTLLLSTKYAKVDVEVLVDDVQVRFFLGDAWLPWVQPRKELPSPLSSTDGER